jgi:hypothetical protein
MMSTLEKKEFGLVFLRHVWRLMEQCYVIIALAECDSSKKLELSNLIVSLRIFIFEIEEWQTKIQWSGEPSRIDKFKSDFEQLEFKFANIKGAQYLQELRRKKILVLCTHLRLSLIEAKVLKNHFPCFWSQRYDQLVKYKQKVFLLCLPPTTTTTDNNQWTKKYLSLVKKYKSVAVKVSKGLELYYYFRRVHDHEKTREGRI